MKVEIFEKSLPEAAKEIRIEVFVKEQGFNEEFDETDAAATHFVLYTEEGAAATCRVFPLSPEVYFFGRLAVRKALRGQNLGSVIVNAAEDYVRTCGGKVIQLHAQCQAEPFYLKQGYCSYGEIEEEEGCPHIWMKKEL